MNIDEVLAKRGDAVLPKWERLVSYLKDFQQQLQSMIGPGVRRSVIGGRTYFVADIDRSVWDHPWRPEISVGAAGIGKGTVNGVFPQIRGVPISGVDEDGKPVTVPRIVLTGEENAVTWLCVVVTVDEAGKIAKDGITVQHLKSLDPDVVGAGKNVGYHPLVRLQWDATGKAVLMQHQVTHHNLQHRFVADKTGTRHFFWS